VEVQKEVQSVFYSFKVSNEDKTRPLTAPERELIFKIISSYYNADLNKEFIGMGVYAGWAAYTKAIFRNFDQDRPVYRQEVLKAMDGKMLEFFNMNFPLAVSEV
jgi:hypothetical protein